MNDTLAERFTRRFSHDAPLALALGLMAHDPTQPYRAGYSRENAALAAAGVFGVTVDHVLAEIDATIGDEREGEDRTAAIDLERLRARYPDR